MKTFYSYSFGCRVNEAEKEEIDRKMILNDFKYDQKRPDFFIINSCAVTNKAEREVRQLIYQIKRSLPKAKIVITGCAATYWLKNKLYQYLPVDLIVNNINKEFLVQLFHRGGGGIIGLKTDFSKFLKSGRMIIKIQDGCQRFCSFCIVPYLRGLPKSYKIEEIIDKINLLSSRAKRSDLNRKEIASSSTSSPPRNDIVSEVILTAINTQAYGYDTGESFIDLVKNIIKKTSIPRISFGSIHPWSINDDFLRFYQAVLPKKRLVNFFHIPLQSGSNKMLNLMKRDYTKEEMFEKLKKLQSLNEYALIATDIIVGFLEETDKDFEETYNFLKESPISKFHIFRFSKRSKTSADYMAKRLKEPTTSVKIKRAKALAELSLKKYDKFLQKNLGRTSAVLLLQKKINGFQEGLLDNQLPIFVPIPPKRWNEAETIKNVKIMEFKKGRLFGKIV